jgi:hypothetical protein
MSLSNGSEQNSESPQGWISIMGILRAVLKLPPCVQNIVVAHFFQTLCDLTAPLFFRNWELASYVPIEWVRTKFRISAGMDFDYGDEDSKNSQSIIPSESVEISIRIFVGPRSQY